MSEASSKLWFAKAVDVIVTGVREGDLYRRTIDGERKTKRVQAEMMAPYDRLPKLTVSLETLLILNGSEHIRSNLAEGTALLLGTDFAMRGMIDRFVKKVAKARRCTVSQLFREALMEWLGRRTFLGEEEKKALGIAT